jgi:hypothetical protein
MGFTCALSRKQLLREVYFRLDSQVNFSIEALLANPVARKAAIASMRFFKVTFV